jgi:His-Xaa-Ser system protein HxsD
MVVKIFDESSFQITIDSNLYSSEVVHKCFYWYGGKFLVDIKTEGSFFVISLSNPNKEVSIEKILNQIKTDLIDFQTREIVSKETKNIREMLIAKAFAHDDEFDEFPPNNVNDPLGFDPSKI